MLGALRADLDTWAWIVLGHFLSQGGQLCTVGAATLRPRDSSEQIEAGPGSRFVVAKVDREWLHIVRRYPATFGSNLQGVTRALSDSANDTC